jgi:hypothetical protein
MAKELDTEFIRWSLDARNGIQAAILNLAACYKMPELKAEKMLPSFASYPVWRSPFGGPHS